MAEFRSSQRDRAELGSLMVGCVVPRPGAAACTKALIEAGMNAQSGVAIGPTQTLKKRI